MHSKISPETWIIFGRWMACVSGIVLLCVAFYWEKDLVSLLLRIWCGGLGLFGIYTGLRR